MVHFFFYEHLIEISQPQCDNPNVTNTVTFQYICLTLQGNDGGPLVYQEYDGVYTQIGIVSFGPTAGCQLGYPVGFTRVAAFLGWISEKTGIVIV